MNRKRVLVAVAVGLSAFVVLTPPAAAEFTENEIGCAGSARITSDDGETYDVDATDTTAVVPRDGRATWEGSVSPVTHDHAGEIVIKIGPVKQKIGDWGPSRNTGDEPSKTGVKEIPSFFAQVPSGKYELSGFHRGDEGRCAGKMTVEIDGSAFETPMGLAAAVLSLLSLAGFLFGALRGSAVLGAVGGLLLGLFGPLQLVFMEVLSSGTPLFLVAPVVLLVVGAVAGIIRGRALAAV